MTQTLDNAAGGAQRSGMWATIALAAGLCLVFASSLIDVRRSNAALTAVDRQQVARLAVARRAENQLNALARGVEELVKGGNANAATVVDILNRNGIRIKSGPPQASP